MRRAFSWLRVVATSLPLVIVAPAHAADATKPHPHRGVLAPFRGAPPLPQLSTTEQAELAAGRLVIRPIEGRTDGRVMAFARVKAPPATVWSVITNFAAFPRYDEQFKGVDVYRHDGDLFDVKFTVARLGVQIVFFVRHDYRMKELWGTWTLDYARDSDVDDSVGFWRVTPIAGSPSESLLEHSEEVRLKGWMPDFLKGIATDIGLKSSVEWVRRASERQRASP